jgi:hypothetical protein
MNTSVEKFEKKNYFFKKSTKKVNFFIKINPKKDQNFKENYDLKLN